jgi:hypothetical protein
VTVRELIEKLSKLPQDKLVCIGLHSQHYDGLNLLPSGFMIWDAHIHTVDVDKYPRDWGGDYIRLVGSKEFGKPTIIKRDNKCT